MKNRVRVELISSVDDFKELTFEEQVRYIKKMNNLFGVFKDQKEVINETIKKIHSTSCKTADYSVSVFTKKVYCIPQTIKEQYKQEKQEKRVNW